MRAVFVPRYGSPEVLEFRDIPKPKPKDDEILIRVRYTTLHVGDTRIRAFRVPAAMWLPARLYLGILRPRRPILGMELSGVVEVVGKDVTRFKPGDRVLATTGFVGGAHAEYVCLPEDGDAHKQGLAIHVPEGLSMEEAAALPNGAITAHLILRGAGLEPGRRILIYGASGSVGTNAIQLAKHLGAHVTAVCSGRNLELVRRLGADAALDYTRDDFDLGRGEYDVVFDAVGKLSRRQAKRALQKGGLYLNANSSSNEQEFGRDELLYVAGLAQAGVLEAVIDRRYPFEDIAEAHRYVDTGRKRGHVIIEVSPLSVSDGRKTSL
ncbi:MAG TPA: NAD(P)-dependent alcohol dehydrogenase [Polyangiaceae bacterium]|nr:NAD(P)-dependent alcohol dehydrogenase [Polyangiaceae bacterium]